ncbi:hypothetical protein [Winogradskyella sp.]|uniref:hypothetical protein n=1 Tax=Winogradskyella sp. TaxID=1883156 RepID=UPI00261CC78A|nr:hypothetical protein [Winogradskyella sp.]
MIYKRFFWFLYSYYKKGNVDMLFSSVCAIVGLQVLNLIFIQGFIFFHLMNRRDLSFTPILGGVIITLLLIINYLYFKSCDIKAIENDYNGLSKEEKRAHSIFYFLYIAISIILAVLMAVSIKNNFKWV